VSWLDAVRSRLLLRLGVLGVGRRGSQAVLDTWARNENVQLVAIGELFKDRLEGGIANLKRRAPQQFEKNFKVDTSSSGSAVTRWWNRTSTTST